MVRFSKYEFYNKLLDSITLFIVTLGVTLSNVTPPNNLLLNSYFKNFTIKLYVFNMHTNIHANQLLFTIRSINSFFSSLFQITKT